MGEAACDMLLAEQLVLLAIDPSSGRTAVVLATTGPGQLLEVIAAERATGKHARRRVDHALDETVLAQYGESVRKVLAEDHAAAIGATTVATTAAVVGGR